MTTSSTLSVDITAPKLSAEHSALLHFQLSVRCVCEGVDARTVGATHPAQPGFPSQKSRGPSARMELERAVFGALNFGSHLISKSSGQGTGSVAFATARERFVHVSARSTRNCGDRNRCLLKVDSLVVRIAQAEGRSYGPLDSGLVRN